MTRGLKSGTAIVALLAGLGMGFGAGSAQAADLGGDCCADLEERIAELEATTARKGNRKVKLEVSGHVNEAIIFWDDGVESNAGVYTNDASRTRFRFKGSAKISSDVSAGYLLEIGVRSANSKRFDQEVPNPGDESGLDLRHSVWYLDSKTFGRVWVGRTAGAAEAITEINLAQTGVVLKYADPEDLAGGLETRVGGVLQGQSWRRLIGAGGSGTSSGEGNRYQMVRYDTPEFAGFIGTANWGADDTWELGLRYKGEFGGFKIAAGFAYGENTDGGEDPGNDCAIDDGAPRDADCQYFGGSISVMHTPTGLYGNIAAGEIDDNNVGAGLDSKNSFYAFEAGIEQTWTPLGKTTLFGQYYKSDGGFLDRDFDVFGGPLSGSEMEGYGFGLAQGIDAAAMTMYVLYRHTEGDITDLATGTTVSLDDVDAVVAGALIKF